MKKTIVSTSLLAFLGFAAVGCYGPFRLTKGLHQWNGSIAGKWPREGIFLALVVLPVYSITALVDAVVTNSYEFWTGKNMLASGKPQDKHLAKADESAVLHYNADGSLNIETSKGIRRDHLTFKPTNEGMGFFNEKGQLVMLSKTEADGSVVVENAKGGQVARYTPEEAQEILSRR